MIRLHAMDLLQRLRQDHRVERPVAEAREPRLEVALDHVDAALRHASTFSSAMSMP
jgi:hypothetical protein